MLNLDIFPTDKIAGEQLSYKLNTLGQRAISGAYRAFELPSHYWVIDVATTMMSKQEAREVQAFCMAQRGGTRTFEYLSVVHSNPSGVATGTPVANGSQALGVETISTAGWTASTANILKSGDVLRFANHNKVYQVVLDATSNASGVASLRVSPALVQAVPANTAIIVNNVPFTVTVREAVPLSIKAGTVGAMALELKLEEVWNA